MSPTDKYRAAARHQAWYADDEPSPYNPFRRRRTFRHEPRLDDVETAGEYSNRITIQPDEIQLRATGRTDSSQNVLDRRDSSQDVVEPTHESTYVETIPYMSEMDKIEQSGDTSVANQQLESATSESLSKPRRKRLNFLRKSTGDEDRVTQEKKKSRHRFTAMGQLRATLLNSWINVLLVFVPIGFAVRYASFSAVTIFVINFIAIMPMSMQLANGVDELELRVGEIPGALLSATFRYDN